MSTAMNVDQLAGQLLAPTATKPLETDVATRVESSVGLAVTDAQSYALAVGALQGLAGVERRVADFFRPFKDLAHKLHKSLCDKEREILAPIARESVRLNQELRGFKAREAQRKRDEEERLAREARERQEAQATRAAAELEARGQHQQASQVLEQAISMPAPAIVLADAVPKVDGVSYREEWKWRVLNEALVPREFLCLDESKIGRYVRAMKKTGSIPGVEIYCEQAPVIRRA